MGGNLPGIYNFKVPYKIYHKNLELPFDSVPLDVEDLEKGWIILN